MFKPKGVDPQTLSSVKLNVIHTIHPHHIYGVDDRSYMVWMTVIHTICHPQYIKRENVIHTIYPLSSTPYKVSSTPLSTPYTHIIYVIHTICTESIPPHHIKCHPHHIHVIHTIYPRFTHTSSIIWCG